MAEIDIPHLVAQNYDDGAFGYLTPKGVRTECDMVGDSLFAYAVKEAGDCGDMEEFLRSLEFAEGRLRALREKLAELNIATLQGARMSDPTYTCPDCGSENVAVTAEQMFMVNTGEHRCHSVKTQDHDAKAQCLDCNWGGERRHLVERKEPS